MEDKMILENDLREGFRGHSTKLAPAASGMGIASQELPSGE